MKAPLTVTTILMLMVLPGCGGDTHESLGAETLATMKQLVTTLDGVKDEASAKSAKPTLQSLMDKMNDIGTRETKLPAPTEADMKAMDSKYGKEMEELSRRLQANMMRVAFDPKISAVLDGIDMKKMR